MVLKEKISLCFDILSSASYSIWKLPHRCVRFDPDFVCNASDKRGRYSYQAQPSVCCWNLARLAEALGSELDAAQAGVVLDEFMPTYEAFYLCIMRRKLGLVRHEAAEDSELISDLLRVMHNTGTITLQLLYLGYKDKWCMWHLDVTEPVSIYILFFSYDFAILSWHSNFMALCLLRCRFHQHLPSAQPCPLAWGGRQWEGHSGTSSGPHPGAVCLYWRAKGG